jgi:GalNAc-alpha-(1->4)-GalNAc-alpha-(1->3)-diNAcBac-PP-undecaprenol alpha-1,4-N-acetyl-D-galactosaminyltransferase
VDNNKIVLVIASLRGGGAERVLVDMANYWQVNKKKVFVITFDSYITPYSYKLEKGVTLINQNTVYSRYSHLNFLLNLKRIIWLRKKFKEINATNIISFITSTNIICIVASLCLPSRLIVSERTDPSKNNEIGITVKILRQIFYRFSYAIVVQNEVIKEWFTTKFFRNVNVIPNSVRSLNPCVNNKENLIVSFGRLSEEKGFEILIKAFNQIVFKLPNWKIFIFGDGTHKNKLISLINNLGLEKNVFIYNRTDNIEYWLSKAKFVVQPSLYEGMPNIILESMSLGSLVIASSTGAEQVINDKVDGIIFPVKDYIKLSEIIYNLSNDESKVKFMSRNAIKIRDVYSQNKIMLLWNNVMKMQ